VKTKEKLQASIVPVTLECLLEKGQYNYIDSSISKENISLSGKKRKVSFETICVSGCRECTSGEKIRDVFLKRGLPLSTPEDLLFFGAFFSEFEILRPIVALRNTVLDKFLCISGNGEGRKLVLLKKNEIILFRSVFLISSPSES